MRRLGLVVLVLLVAGIFVLVGQATKVVLTGDAIEVAAGVHGVVLAQFAREAGVAPTVARRPVPGARLSFVAGERVLAKVESGRDGRFEAAFDVQGACELVVEAPEGWRAMETKRALSK